VTDALQVPSAGSATRTTMLYVVRHGRTALNAAGRLRGRHDVPLDHVGCAEAAELGRLFIAAPLDAIYCSPLLRAVETAIAIATTNATSGLDVTIDDRLVDRDYGPWAGERREELEERFGSLDAAPGVEPAEEVVARVRAVASDIFARYRGHKALVVAHDAVNRFLLRAVCNLAAEENEIPQPTGCWNLVTETKGGWAAAVIGAVPGDGRLP
jgi:broad specificity phosphatase PhoE